MQKWSKTSQNKNVSWWKSVFRRVWQIYQIRFFRKISEPVWNRHGTTKLPKSSAFRHAHWLCYRQNVLIFAKISQKTFFVRPLASLEHVLRPGDLRHPGEPVNPQKLRLEEFFVGKLSDFECENFVCTTKLWEIVKFWKMWKIAKFRLHANFAKIKKIAKIKS